MVVLCICMAAVILVLAVLLYLELEMFQISVLDRRNRRHEELAFLSRDAECGQTVFFGDSITQYCPVEEIYASYTAKCGQRVYNRGIASETTEDALRRLESNVLCLKPGTLVILYGCNDIGKKIPAARTVQNIEKIIVRTREVNPEVRILLQAVYPVRETGNKLAAKLLIGGRTCEKVRLLNRALEEMADRLEVPFADLTDVLADESGQLKAEYTADGLHVNEKAYRRIAARIMPLLLAKGGSSHYAEGNRQIQQEKSGNRHHADGNRQMQQEKKGELAE